MLDRDADFVNRTEELRLLRDRISPRAVSSCITVLRSPAGFGKSRLTGRLVATNSEDGPSFIIVDPAVRSAARSDRGRAWHFVQRAAEFDSHIHTPGHREFEDFSAYVRSKKLATVDWDNVYANAKELGPVNKFVRFFAELIETIFKNGKQDPAKLLESDANFAVDLARRYLRDLASFRPTVVIVRGAQDIDIESLGFFLALADDAPKYSLILEYTTQDRKISSDHEDAIMSAASESVSVRILDLLELKIGEVRRLLQLYELGEREIETVARLKWDGNIRKIRELRFQVLAAAGPKLDEVMNLDEVLATRIASMPRRERLLIALVLAHGDEIPIESLCIVARRIDPRIDATRLTNSSSKDREELALLVVRGNRVSIKDLDAAAAIRRAPELSGLLRLSQTVLREYYIEVIDCQEYREVAFDVALRQAVSLCALRARAILTRRSKALVYNPQYEERRANLPTIRASGGAFG